MKRYISDLHFCGEECITNFDRRSFANAQEMDKYMIKQWNATIKVVILLLF
jgi:calcineurin-like phosphoesterase family protein